MLRSIGCGSLSELIDEAIPDSIRIPSDSINTEGGRDSSGKKVEADVSLNFFSMTEQEASDELRVLSYENIVLRSYIGCGYYNCILPPVIRRNLLENPTWYTAYTPYQAEISQGRLESLLNFQTVVTELTGMEISNASLLDESTAAAEAMAMVFRAFTSSRTTSYSSATIPPASATETSFTTSNHIYSCSSMVTAAFPPNNSMVAPPPCFFVSSKVHPQTIDVLRARASPIGLNVIVGDHQQVNFKAKSNLIGVLVQYPNTEGIIEDFTKLGRDLHSMEAQLVVATDPLALCVLKPPSEFGADIVVGSMQRFGVPMGFGGPHAAFLATSKSNLRRMPGRLIGRSVDCNGDTAYRMAMQTREQHIRKEKATSNICTAQALLANVAAMYAIYHGPRGLEEIAARVHALARLLKRGLKSLGYEVGSSLRRPPAPTAAHQVVVDARGHDNGLRNSLGTSESQTNQGKENFGEEERADRKQEGKVTNFEEDVERHFFDTLKVYTGGLSSSAVLEVLQGSGINVRELGVRKVGIALDETTTEQDIRDLIAAMATAKGFTRA